jgi:two-component system, LytTR family, sensor histidine kinase AlgZ
MPVVTGTWRALGSPKRALPLGLLLVGLLSAEWLATESGAALVIDVGFFLAFCLAAPAGYRLLARDTGSLGVGHVLYALLCAVIVFGIAALARLALELEWTYVVDASSLGILWVLFLVGGWGLARDIELEAGFVAEHHRAQRFAENAERASLLALRAHLDPHFLFNTLNAIAEWCREDPAVAEAATLRLASMLRTMLGGIRSPSWPLSTEIALAQSLFDLYAIRDRAKFRFRIDAPDPLPVLHVPPMLFLPLFENAVTHGPCAGHSGEIVVRLRLETEAPHLLEVEIENPGVFGGRREGGEGIAMVERRLALAYGGRAKLSFGGDRERTLTCVAVPSLSSAEVA